MTPQEEANRLRWESGLGPAAIARRIGVSPTTVHRWTSEEQRERDVQRSRAYRKRNRERVRTYDSKRRRDACPVCGGPKTIRSELCAGCSRFAGKQRQRFIQIMWKDGHTVPQIAALLETTTGSVQTSIARMRRAGWDMPYRRSPQLQEAA